MDGKIYEDVLANLVKLSDIAPEYQNSVKWCRSQLKQFEHELREIEFGMFNTMAYPKEEFSLAWVRFSSDQGHRYGGLAFIDTATKGREVFQGISDMEPEVVICSYQSIPGLIDQIRDRAAALIALAKNSNETTEAIARAFDVYRKMIDKRKVESESEAAGL